MAIRIAPAWHFHRGEWVCISLYSQQSQKGRPEVVNPFGGTPFALEKGVERQFAGPLGAFFGAEPVFGQGPRGRRRQAAWQQQRASLAEGTGPLAQFAQQAAGYLPQVFGQAQGVGQRIASMAPQVYDLLRQQIGGALGALPGIQRGAAGQTAAAQGQLGTAERFLQEAQSPLASQALYQDALRQALEGARGGAAGRGLLDAGAAQSMEEILGRDLASQFAQRRFGEQQAALGGAQGALGGVQQALGTQAGLLPLGASLAGMQGEALPQLFQALQAGYQLPQQALQQVYQQLAAFQDPRLALLQLTAPQVGQRTEGGGFGILSTSGSKYAVVYWKGYK